MRIKSITEAFSIQPEKWVVCNEGSNYHKSKPEDHLANCVFRIEKFQIDQYEWIYVAYDFRDRKIHEWQSKSVNVEFYYPELL